MEATGTGTGTVESTTQSGTTQATVPASPPSSSNSQAAGATNAAPVANPAREAYERLAKGEKPEAVNADLYRTPKSKSTAPAPAPRPAAETAATTQSSAPAGEEEGIGEKDLSVLKRAKFDLSTWKHIPPSNRKAIVATLRNSQAETDRQFQQAKTGKTPAAAATTQAPPPSRQEEATHGTENGDAGDGQQSAQEQEEQPTGKAANATATRQQAASIFEMDPASFVDPKDLQTLEAIGGKDLAEIHTRGIARVAQAMQQQVGALLPALEHLLGQENSRQMQQGIDRLSKQPGFEALATDNELQNKLQAKAQRLLRAADDAGYSFQDALDDAAAGLFKTNAHAIAQARLTKGRESSLRGQPDRGSDTRSDQRPLSTQERNQAIFAKLREGFGPDEARRAVDGH